MTMLRRRRFGLIGQIVVILLIAVVAEFAASTILYERASEFSIRDDEARRLGEHLVVARRLLDKVAPERRAATATALSTDHYAVGWIARAPARPANGLTVMRSQILAWEPSLATANLWLARRLDGLSPQIGGGLTLADRSGLTFRTLRAVGDDADWWRGRILMAALLGLLVIGSAGLLVRNMLDPLRRLARAADRFGAAAPEHLDEAGPDEVRHVIAAFNRMQSRIQRLIAERTQALAAVGHDLRTPLTRLRLRTDGIADPHLRATMSADVVEMEEMVTSLLAYLGGEGDPETPSLTDLAVLCTTLADAAADRGHAVDYDGPDHCELIVRRISLKRAISNLIENATHYGSMVWLTLDLRDDALCIVVEDDGPGIPEESLQSVIEPFVRLDAARRRDTIGLGLGLAIVARVTAVEGGKLTLSNRDIGGLRAELCLPRG